MKVFSLFFFFVISLLLLSFVSAVEPSGATVNVTGTTSTPTGTASSTNAYAGNVSAINVFSSNSVTQTWQGYYGNVSGGIRLADASNNILYNWSLASPSGEVYSSTNQTLSWANIQCFNMSASGDYTDESGNGGTTNLYGSNKTIINFRFNNSDTDLDNLNNTFDTFNHDAFFTAGQSFSDNECPSLQLLNNNSLTSDGNFEEVLLYEPTTDSLVFTTLLDNSIRGFDNSLVDFEMIVLEDGHGSNTATTQYYFFIEIE